MRITSLKDVRQPQTARLTSLGPYVVVIVALILSPLYLSPFNLIMLIKILIFALFAMSLDIIFGYTGLPSFGHAIFFGVAAYTTGILIVTYGIGSFWLAAPAGILLAVLAASVFGFVVTRISEVYFMLATFALGQLVYNIDIHWLSMTNGPNGFPGIPRPDLGFPLDMSNDIYFFFLTLIVFFGCFFLLHRIVHSPFGLTLKAIRENEPRMLSLGYRTWVYKYTSFVLGGLFAGVAGVLYAYLNGIVSPSELGIMNSTLVLLSVILGGPGTLFGPAIGAGLIWAMQHFISVAAPQRWQLILGGIFVFSVMYVRGGVAGYLLKFWNRIRLKYGSPTN